MFVHLFKYRILKILRTREELFWTFLFPIILGSFFYFAFGSITEKTETFTSIPIAVVIENQSGTETFQSIISNLDKNTTKDNDSLFEVTYTDIKEAESLLESNTVDGIILLTDTLSLEISQNGINQTILKSFTDNYLQIESVIKTVSANNPEKIFDVVTTLLGEESINNERPLTNGSLDPMLLYFYALIAMSCLFGSQLGYTCAIQMKADLSTLGCRRCIAPVHRMKVILADFFATVLVHFGSILTLIFYLSFILKIELGSQLFFIILTGFIGSVIGISYGVFIGSVPCLSGNVKMAFIMGSTMLLSFFSGLMVFDMKYTVEKFCPLLNRINPAALISDALYALNIYETHERYLSRLILMLVIAAIFCILSYLFTRREDYDSL